MMDRHQITFKYQSEQVFADSCWETHAIDYLTCQSFRRCQRSCEMLYFSRSARYDWKCRQLHCYFSLSHFWLLCWCYGGWFQGPAILSLGLACHSMSCWCCPIRSWHRSFGRLALLRHPYSGFARPRNQQVVSRAVCHAGWAFTSRSHTGCDWAPHRSLWKSPRRFGLEALGCSRRSAELQLFENCEASRCCREF